MVGQYLAVRAQGQGSWSNRAVLVSSPYDNLRLKLSIFIQFISISTLEIFLLIQKHKRVEMPIAPRKQSRASNRCCLSSFGHNTSAVFYCDEATMTLAWPTIPLFNSSSPPTITYLQQHPSTSHSHPHFGYISEQSFPCSIFSLFPHDNTEIATNDLIVEPHRDLPTFPISKPHSLHDRSNFDRRQNDATCCGCPVARPTGRVSQCTRWPTRRHSEASGCWPRSS
jgi:hypothetical protein